MKGLLLLLVTTALLQIALSREKKQVRFKLLEFKNHNGVEGLDPTCCDTNPPIKLSYDGCSPAACDHTFKVFGGPVHETRHNLSDWSGNVNMLNVNFNKWGEKGATVIKVGRLHNFFKDDIPVQYEGEYEIQVDVREDDQHGRLEGDNPVVTMSYKFNLMDYHGDKCWNEEEFYEPKWGSPDFTLKLQVCFLHWKNYIGQRNHDNRNGKHGRGKRNLGLYDDDDDEDETDVYSETSMKINDEDGVFYADDLDDSEMLN